MTAHTVSLHCQLTLSAHADSQDRHLVKTVLIDDATTPNGATCAKHRLCQVAWRGKGLNWQNRGCRTTEAVK